MARVFGDRVMEGSNSTGRGLFQLQGAPVGFQPFAAVAQVGDTFDYAIYAIDNTGKPTGDWETGTGTFSANNTLARTTVQSSSFGNVAVDFQAGPKAVVLTQTAKSVSGGNPNAMSGASIRTNTNKTWNGEGESPVFDNDATTLIDYDLGGWVNLAAGGFTIPLGVNYVSVTLQLNMTGNQNKGTRIEHNGNLVALSGDLANQIFFNTTVVLAVAPGDTIHLGGYHADTVNRLGDVPCSAMITRLG